MNSRRKMMNSILRSILVIPILLSAKSLQATTIIVFVTSAYVLLGVDSKLTIENTITGEVRDSATTKLYQTNDYFFAMQGVYSLIENTDHFAKKLGSQLNSGKELSESVQSANLEIKKALNDQAGIIQEKWPDYYESEYLDKKFILSYIIVGVKDKIPFAYKSAFVLEDSSEYDLSIQESHFPVATSKPTDAKGYYLGEHDAIDNYMKRPENISNTTPEKLVETLFEIQIQATPSTVGPPVNIVKIEKDGAVSWIKRDETCPILID